MSSPDALPPTPPLTAPAVRPLSQRTKRRLKRVGPLSAGTMLALLYGVMGLIFLPFFLLAMMVAQHAPEAAQMPAGGMFIFSAGFALLAPVMYAVMGFLTGVIGAALYNLFARWTGGIDVEVE